MKNSNIIYTYPNTSSIPQRGGVKSRYLKLKEINNKLDDSVFQIVEIPADFIKNTNEEKRTGLPVGSFLDDNSVQKIYTNDNFNFKYILHTDPVFNRKGLNGNRTSKLHWYNSSWFENFVKHIFSIVDFFDSTPYAVEIHPGQYERGKNNIKTFSAAIKQLHNIYSDKYGKDLLIFIENRTNQYIQLGSDVKRFWNYFNSKYPDLIYKTGIVLDIQQLFTATKNQNKNFKIEFSNIPQDSLIGTHIHERHFKPQCKHIPPQIWNYLADNHGWVNQNRLFHVLPEVHPHSHIIPTYKFCKNYLRI